MRRFTSLFLGLASLGIAFGPPAYADDAKRVTWQPSSSGSCEDCNLFGRQMPFWDLTEARYDGANISHASLHGAKARGAYFNGITAKFSDFSRSDVSNAHFENAQMQNARLSDLTANGANFSGAILDRSSLNKALMVGANLTSVSARYVQARGADFSAASAAFAIFDGANLRGATFNGALLSGSSFSQSDLSGASFQDARLAGADFSSAINTAQANFAGACGDTLTRLPGGLSLPRCIE